MTPAADQYQCSFCGEVVGMGALGEGLLITVKRIGGQPWQELFAHPACLGQALHPSVPFDPGMFDH